MVCQPKLPHPRRMNSAHRPETAVFPERHLACSSILVIHQHVPSDNGLSVDSIPIGSMVLVEKC